jgi:phenylpropionate dioxygenase-like ring-hydroxylating dioxygenase large terminal subunit
MSETIIASDNTAIDVDRCYDNSTGILDRRIFSDENIYQQELKKIFGRAWNFICHESQIPDSGNFFVNFIGEDEVIAVRDRKGSVNVLLNSCPHRGNTVCRAELGTTKSFFCSYHGWNFDLDGTLIAAPNEEAFYRGDLDKKEWGLTAAKVESYKGFVFATLDPEAPPLTKYLGWVGKLGIDMMTTDGDIQFLDGVHKNRIKCNWKIAVDNLYDWYHVKVSHGTSFKLGLVTEEAMAPNDQMVILGELGHGIGGPGLTLEKQAEFDQRQATGKGDEQWYDLSASHRTSESVREMLGPIGFRSFGHPNIFPNLWVTNTRQMCLRIPRGPFETELWWFNYLPVNLPESQRMQSTYAQNHIFGPAGFLEQDDGENWSHSTRGARGTKSSTLPLNFSMGLGRDVVSNDPSGQSAIETVVNEHGQRWTYQSWKEWLQADSWEALLANHSAPPRGEV